MNIYEIKVCIMLVGGSVVLFGKNRVLKLAMGNKIVQVQRVRFGNQRPISEWPIFSQIAQLTHLFMVNSPEHYFKTQKAISKN